MSQHWTDVHTQLDAHIAHIAAVLPSRQDLDDSDRQAVLKALHDAGQHSHASANHHEFGDKENAHRSLQIGVQSLRNAMRLLEGASRTPVPGLAEVHRYVSTLPQEYLNQSGTPG